MENKKTFDKSAFEGAEALKKFIKKHKEEFDKIFPKDFRNREGVDIGFEEIIDRFIDEARDTGIKGRELFRIMKDDFKLKFDDRDKVISEFKDRLEPHNNDKKLDNALKKRREYIQNVIAAYNQYQTENKNQ